DLSDLIVSIPGPTRAETASSLGRVPLVRLTDQDRTLLDERIPAVQSLRHHGLGRRDRTASPRKDGEIVMIMGLPGAGKSTAATALLGQGYVRLNRDEAGGSLRQLLPAVGRFVASGGSRIVLDNTYVSRKSRASLIQLGEKVGLPVRCVWLSSSIEDAQVN